MIEVECKLKIDNKVAIECKLKELGFILVDNLTEVDRYFDNLKGDIKANDSALRIRVTTNNDTNDSSAEINFKGPKLDNVSVSRPEYETIVDDAPATEKILNSLGYYPVKPIVEKQRTTYSCNDMTACLDSVKGLGDFLELEVLVCETSEKDSALLRIEEMLKVLGYNIADTTTKSYLSQLMGI